MELNGPTNCSHVTNKLDGLQLQSIPETKLQLATLHE